MFIGGGRRLQDTYSGRKMSKQCQIIFVVALGYIGLQPLRCRTECLYTAIGLEDELSHKRTMKGSRSVVGIGNHGIALPIFIIRQHVRAIGDFWSLIDCSGIL